MEGWINIVVEADSGSHYQAANQVTTEYIFWNEWNYATAGASQFSDNSYF